MVHKCSALPYVVRDGPGGPGTRGMSLYWSKALGSWVLASAQELLALREDTIKPPRFASWHATRRNIGARICALVTFR